MKANQKTKSVPVQSTSSHSKAAQSFVEKSSVLRIESSLIYIYAVGVTLLFLLAAAGYLRQTIELIGVSSAYHNLRRSNESMIRTCGGFPDPAYVCYGASQKKRLEELLDGRI